MAEAAAETPLVNNTGRLMYANPRSLPSFPSKGLPENGAAAGAAATLGWQNQKPVEIWKPDKLSSASAAAVLAKDYKMPPMWQPSSDPSGHKAAILAVGSANSALKRSHDDPAPKSPHQGWGNTAATQAFMANRASSPRDGNVVTSPPPDNDKPLLAAQGAMSSNRPRTQPPPTSEELRQQSSNTANAMSGATIAHKASMQSKPSAHPPNGAVPVTTMTRNMFTSHPMVKPEVDEQQDSERLHQSAVEMARKMYARQQQMVDQANEAHEGGADGHHVPPALNLQEAAYRQAQERLAKLENEHQKNRELQEYYGNTPATHRRFTVTGKLPHTLRHRHSPDIERDDHQKSQKIRQQMSIFSTKLSEVDEAKRQHDREVLLAAAQRNVKAQLSGMDERVYLDTGRVPQSLQSEWELKAQEAAQAQSSARNEHKGKIDLGGGLFMDQTEVDAIAMKRMKPLMDDLDKKAEAERERQETMRLDEQERKDVAEKQKAKTREDKTLAKQLKAEEKQEQKMRKQQEKAEKAEQKRMTKAGKDKKSKHDSAVGGLAPGEAAEEQRPATESASALGGGEMHPGSPFLILSPEALEMSEGYGSTVRPQGLASKEPQVPEAQTAEERATEPETRAAEPEEAAEQHAEEMRLPEEGAVDPEAAESQATEPQAAGVAVAQLTSTETPMARETAIDRPTTPEAQTGPGVVVAAVAAATANPEEALREPTKAEESSSPRHKLRVREWIRNRLHRGKSVSQSEGAAVDEKGKRKSFFIGGAALKKNQAAESNPSVNHEPPSLRDVAMAGKTDQGKEPDVAGPETFGEGARTEQSPSTSQPVERAENVPDRRDSRGVSPVSSLGDERYTAAPETQAKEEFTVPSTEQHVGGSKGDMTAAPHDYGVHGENLSMTPPKPIWDSERAPSSSPTRDSRFKEEMDV